MRVKPDAAKDRDGGYTLVELIVVIVVLGIIMVPLANVVIGYFLDSASISARLGETHDEQIAAAYWQQDVASMGVRSATYDSTYAQTFPFTRSVDTSSSAFPCTGATGTAQAVIAWNQYDTAGVPTLITVEYLTSGTTLLRASCAGSSGAATITTIAHLIDTTQPITVSCYAADGTTQGCGGSYWATNNTSTSTTQVPSKMELTFSVSDPSNSGQPYTVTLTGQRRQT